jgi:hypothetical protein
LNFGDLTSLAIFAVVAMISLLVWQG